MYLLNACVLFQFYWTIRRHTCKFGWEWIVKNMGLGNKQMSDMNPATKT